jgi:predicted acylesterase/phospholipase RssA
MTKIGLSIRGGGMRAVAYAGALQAFDELSIPIYSLVGASGGSVVAASYAFGKTPQEILNHFKLFHPYSIINPLGIFRGKLVNYKKWDQYARGLIPKANIEDSKIKLFVQATSIEKKSVDYLDKGDAIKAVVASSAFIDTFKLKKLHYIDGEYDPEFGADVLRKSGAEKIVGMQIHGRLDQEGALARILMPIRILQKNALEMDTEIHPLDFLVNIKINKGSLFGRTNLDQMFDRGYTTTKSFIKSNNFEEFIK